VLRGTFPPPSGSPKPPSSPRGPASSPSSRPDPPRGGPARPRRPPPPNRGPVRRPRSPPPTAAPGPRRHAVSPPRRRGRRRNCRFDSHAPSARGSSSLSTAPAVTVPVRGPLDLGSSSRHTPAPGGEKISTTGRPSKDSSRSARFPWRPPPAPRRGWRGNPPGEASMRIPRSRPDQQAATSPRPATGPPVPSLHDDPLPLGPPAPSFA
jgi:hypothetical protein